MPGPTVLVTGASGYVGGRLVPELLNRGAQVRCLARNPAKVAAAHWRDDVQVVAGDVGGDLRAAMAGVDVCVYLVHSIGQGPNWADREIADAQNFARAAAAAGVSRIVYLGGLGMADDDLSQHLRSRHVVGEELAGAGVPTIELRAGMVLGSGSASFEMLRYLVEVLPVMVTPKWVGTRCQPISIADVLAYLTAACFSPADVAGVFEIGGPDVLTYAELLRHYADAAGLPQRRLIPVPILTPRLSAHWVGLVTPVPAALAKELVESLVNEVTLGDDTAALTFGVHPISVDEALNRALRHEKSGTIASRFTDADFAPYLPAPTDPSWAGGTVLSDRRQLTVDVDPRFAFAAVARIGGERGWYGGTWLWRIRGLLDQIAGGPGLRRGRRNPDTLAVGEPLDFWRVEDISAPVSLRLRAEMLLPGVAWLSYEVDQASDGQATITQLAEFRPRGLVGRLYWFAIAPFHGLVFPALIRGIASDARELSRAHAGE